MSTTTTTSIPLFTQLINRLRHTNARYNQIAHQCRRTQRLTHHAKRRAYRAGLRIDTSKARVPWYDGDISIQLLPVLDKTAAENPVWAIEEDDSCSSAEDACTPILGLALTNLPEVVAQKERAALCSSPLGLGLGLDLNVDGDLIFRGPVPSAPRWQSKPLPEDECGTLQSVSCCTYDPAWRGVMTMHASDSVSFGDVVYAGRVI